MKKSKYRGPENLETRKLVVLLEKAARKNKAAIWKDVAELLLSPARKRKARSVNVYKLDKLLKAGETAVIPTTLLGIGTTSKDFVVGAFRASDGARLKLGKKLVSISEIVRKNPSGKGVRIIIG